MEAQQCRQSTEQLKGQIDEGQSSVCLARIPHPKKSVSSGSVALQVEDTVSTLVSRENHADEESLTKNKTKLIQKLDSAKQRKHGKEPPPKNFCRLRRKIWANNWPAVQNVHDPVITQKDRRTPTKCGISRLEAIIDWQMELCSNLYLSKDAFYSAVSMSRQIFSSPLLCLFSEKMITNQAIAIVCLAAKADDASLNYMAVLSQMFSSDEQEIAAAEMAIFKVFTDFTQKMGFHLRLGSVWAPLAEVCSRWHSFIMGRADELGNNFECLKLGELCKRESWEESVENKFQDILYFFDALLLRAPLELELHSHDDLKAAATFALFIVINYCTQGFFPMKLTDRSYLRTIFFCFLSLQCQHSQAENQRWMAKLITLRHKLNIVENTCKYFSLRYPSGHEHYPSLRCEASQGDPLHQQLYHPSIVQWK